MLECLTHLGDVRTPRIARRGSLIAPEMGRRVESLRQTGEKISPLSHRRRPDGSNVACCVFRVSLRDTCARSRVATRKGADAIARRSMESGIRDSERRIYTSINVITGCRAAARTRRLASQPDIHSFYT